MYQRLFLVNAIAAFRVFIAASAVLARHLNHIRGQAGHQGLDDIPQH